MTHLAPTSSANEDQHDKASAPERNSSPTIEQVLAQRRSVASHVTNMDQSVGTRLDVIDGSLGNIKTSVASVENSLSILSNQVTDIEKRMEEAESRVSVAEDSLNTNDTKLTAMEKTLELLKLKVDDLKNRWQYKNLKTVNLPEASEGDSPLADFLQKLLPVLGGLLIFPRWRLNALIAPWPPLQRELNLREASWCGFCNSPKKKLHSGLL